MSEARRLPRGRHGLSPEEVALDQRVRIVAAMAESMAVRGYTGTSVAEVIGRGATSTVFRGEDRRLRRSVAIKVLTAEAAQGQSREQFAAEANVMAQLSTHSSIVTIYHADTAADGRPYLVMQYCPLPNLSERLKVRPLPVPEVLAPLLKQAIAEKTLREKYAEEFWAYISSTRPTSCATPATARSSAPPTSRSSPMPATANEAGKKPSTTRCDS